MEIAVPGQVAIDRGTVRRSDGLGWHDFALGTAVLETLSEAGIDQASVGVSNVCQLAALYASRIELPVGRNGIAVYLGGTAGSAAAWSAAERSSAEPTAGAATSPT